MQDAMRTHHHSTVNRTTRPLATAGGVQREHHVFNKYDKTLLIVNKIPPGAFAPRLLMVVQPPVPQDVSSLPHVAPEPRDDPRIPIAAIVEHLVDLFRVHDQLVYLPQAAQLRRKRQRLRHRYFFVVRTMNHQQRNGDPVRPLHDRSFAERGGASTRRIGNQLHHAVGNAGHALLQSVPSGLAGRRCRRPRLRHSPPRRAQGPGTSSSRRVRGRRKRYSSDLNRGATTRVRRASRHRRHRRRRTPPGLPRRRCRDTATPAPRSRWRRAHNTVPPLVPGVPRSRHIRPRRFTRQCLPIGGDRR